MPKKRFSDERIAFALRQSGNQIGEIWWKMSGDRGLEARLQPPSFALTLFNFYCSLVRAGSKNLQEIPNALREPIHVRH
jgi:hypothetical protein